MNIRKHWTDNLTRGWALLHLDSSLELLSLLFLPVLILMLLPLAIVAYLASIVTPRR